MKGFLNHSLYGRGKESTRAHLDISFNLPLAARKERWRVLGWGGHDGDCTYDEMGEVEGCVRPEA